MNGHTTPVVAELLKKIHTRWIRFSKIYYADDYSNLEHNDLVTDLGYEKLEEIDIWVVHIDDIFHVYLSYSNATYPKILSDESHYDIYHIMNIITNIKSAADIVWSCLNKFHDPRFDGNYAHCYTNAISWNSVFNRGKSAWKDYVEQDLSIKTIMKRLYTELYEFNCSPNLLCECKIEKFTELINDSKPFNNVNELPYIARSKKEKYHIIL